MSAAVPDDAVEDGVDRHERDRPDDGPEHPRRTDLGRAIRAVAKNPGFSRPSAFGTIASTMSARVSAVTDGET